MRSIAVARIMSGLRFVIFSALLCLGAARAWADPAIGVSHPWFRYLLATVPAGAYVDLHNKTAHPVVLTGASSPGCGMMMLHETVSTGGTEKMVAVPSVTIPPRGNFAFRPGGYHIMCMKPHMKPGDTVPVTLKFATSGPLTVPFRVYGATGKPAAK
jgi:periplasmic copper chaperone A